MIDFERELNPSQLDAVRSVDGPLLVIAGAGSGKTRVIEYRVLYLVQQGIAPQSILLLTFTRKAASQMLARASRHDLRCSSVEGGTFHSFAYRILKKYASRLGFQSFTILDEADAENAVNLCVGKLGLDTSDKRFPRKDTLRKIISMSINKNKPVQDIVDAEYPNFSSQVEAIEKVRDAYRKYKQEKGYLDYDDLLVYLSVLLSRNEDIRRDIAKQYRYIMVDEYQDTNKLQADITYFLAQDHRNCMAVGDDAQSIYGFRGASHENIMEFPRRFTGTRIIKLEANYRSSQPILDVANAVLRNMRSKFAKDLFSATEHRGTKPQLLFFQDNSMEAEWISQKVLELRNDGIDFSKQAVLFRSAYVSILLQMELTRKGIPFQVFGGMKFYETAHVKDLLAHVKVILNPHDEISWSRLLTLLEGIGPRTAARIISAIETRQAISEITRDILCGEFAGYKYGPGLRRLADALDAASGRIENLESAVNILLDYYDPVLKARFDDWNQRINDLHALKQIAGRYTSVQDFLAEFSLEPPDYGVARAAAQTPDDERPLTLSTIHSAKGLEWECVFLIGLIDGILPVSFSLEDDDRLEEEHRLFYVGLTRAKSQLYLSVHHEGNGMGMAGFNKVSRFLEPREVLTKLQQDIHIDYDL
jgi:DNA helicase II / ATP-dependent DNA helicase PcrA